VPPPRREVALRAAMSSPCHAILRTHQPMGECTMLHGEPKLEELLSEPIVLLTAKSDHVTVEQLRALCEQVRAQLAQR